MLTPMMMLGLELATGCLGTFTLLYAWRAFKRRLGWVESIEVLFSPKGGCQDAIVRELKKARREVLVQAYSFTADPITYALVEAKKRGAHVDIVLDKSNERESYSDLRIFLDQGLAPQIDAHHAIAHNKVMVIDQKVLITGSFNFTHEAETANAENLIIIKGRPDLIRLYRQNFLAHKGHSKPAEVKEPTGGRGASTRHHHDAGPAGKLAA